jgi:hypothetical protein
MKLEHPAPSEIRLHRSRLDSVANGEAALIVTEGSRQAKRLANAANAYAWGRRQVLDTGCRGLGVRRDRLASTE